MNDEQLSEDFAPVCRQDEVPDGGMKLCELGDRLVIVFRRGDNFYCLDDVCTHDGGTLSDGTIVGCQIACPRHGARFDIETGQAMTMPATQPTRAYPVRLEGAQVLVSRLPR